MHQDDHHTLDLEDEGKADLGIGNQIPHDGPKKSPAQQDTQTSTHTRRPLVIEICAGSAMLSRCFKEQGFSVLPVDHKANRFTPLAEICTWDLSKEHSWEFLAYILQHYPVKFIHAAPPCGTSSRARDIPLDNGGPQPLRSDKEPDGLSTLQGDDLAQVTAANFIYKGVCKLLIQASKLGTAWSVENPARSLMWQTQWFVQLRKYGQFYNFEACAWGSKRQTDKSFLSNAPAFAALQAQCPGGYFHEPYGRKRDSHGKQLVKRLRIQRSYVPKLSPSSRLPYSCTLKLYKLQTPMFHSMQLQRFLRRYNQEDAACPQFCRSL